VLVAVENWNENNKLVKRPMFTIEMHENNNKLNKVRDVNNKEEKHRIYMYYKCHKL
jgi:hypothetical protein